MVPPQTDDDDFGALLAEYEQHTPSPRRRDLPKVGDVVRGRVVSVGRDAVFVSLGGKAEAVLDVEDVSDDHGQARVSVGDTIEANVVDVSGGQITLRMVLGRGPDGRAELAQAHEHGVPIEGVVSGVTKGGVEVQVAGARAFCPVSQLDNRFVEDASAFVGQRLTFRIIRYEAGRGQGANIVLSRRVLLEEEAAAQAVETRARLQVGAVMRGRVTSVKGYGAFVDLGGIEGMLHVSELGFARVEHPGDILSEGQELEVQVIKLEKTGDPKRPEKISLSLKAMATDPWDEAAERLVEGARVHGKVVRLQPFGAFVELQPGVEGLAHISELGAGRRINHPREVMKEGDEVEAVVLSVDRERRRIALSLGRAQARQAEAEEEDAVAAYQPPRSSGFGTLGDLLKKKR